MFYFRCPIPTMPDGKVVTYSPGWAGTRPKCMKNEKGLIYNDREKWLIGQADDGFIAPDVEVITLIEVNKALAGCDAKRTEIEDSVDYLTVKTANGKPANIWYGDKLKNRVALESALKVGIDG